MSASTAAFAALYTAMFANGLSATTDATLTIEPPARSRWGSATRVVSNRPTTLVSMAERGARAGEVAQRVGFESAAHFARELKRRFGRSPTQYAPRAST